MLITQKFLKAISYVEKILPIHEAQLITYMKLLKVAKGIALSHFSICRCG